MPEKYALVFDICSSTSMLEDTKRTDSIRNLTRFLSDGAAAAAKHARHLKADMHKFLGDGFLILISGETRGDDVIALASEIAGSYATLLRVFVGEHIEDENLPRTGITVGIDKGEVYPVTVLGRQEFVSRAINIAGRLQGKLSEPADANCALVSKKVYTEITSKEMRARFQRKEKQLKNISENRPLAFYQTRLLGQEGATRH